MSRPGARALCFNAGLARLGTLLSRDSVHESCCRDGGESASLCQSECGENGSDPCWLGGTLVEGSEHASHVERTYPSAEASTRTSSDKSAVAVLRRAAPCGQAGVGQRKRQDDILLLVSRTRGRALGRRQTRQCCARSPGSGRDDRHRAGPWICSAVE